MPPISTRKLNATTRLGAWHGKQGTMTIPAHVQDIWVNIDSKFEHVDAQHDRLFDIVVFIFGPMAKENVQLESSDRDWLLTTKFGNLTFIKDQFASCNLMEEAGNLIFTSRSARPKLYKIPSRDR